MTPKLIILEGMDSTGKSSLARFLARKLNAFYFHSSGHRTLHVGMQAHHQQILDAMRVNLENGHNCVLDRHWPSQHCYGIVLRPGVGDYDTGKLSAEMMKLGAQYVYCEKPNWMRYKEVHKDHDKKSFHHLSLVQFLDIHCEYEALFNTMDHTKYSIEEHGHDIETFSHQFL